MQSKSILSTNIFLLIFSSLLIYSLSYECNDENCQNCSSDGSLCFICKNNLITYQYHCFKKCNKIKACVLCNLKEDICIKCDYGCKPNQDGICTCTLKYILYGVYCLITIITVGTFLYCLTHNTLIKYFNYSSSMRFRPFNEVTINNNISINNNNFNVINSNDEKKISEEELIEEFNKNKINFNEDIDIEKKKCDCCNNMICNLYLDCGCYVCFECEKKSIKKNYCLNCLKTFNSMSQISCSICFNNKKELGFFNCQCKMVVCKECYIKWRINNKNCPTCRTIII